MPENNKHDTQIIGVRGSAVETARGRLMFMSIMFILIYMVVGARVTWLTLFQEGAEPRFETVAVNQNNAAVIAAGRSDITDRNGILLATTLDTISLFADPSMITNPKQTARDLKNIFPHINEKQLVQKLSGKGRFVWVERGITPTSMKSVNALGQPGLDFRFENKRFYPQGALTSHIIGYTSVDGEGFAGIERHFNKQLKTNPEPLTLSLDIRFQHALCRAMSEAIEKFTAKGAAGLIMDVQSGEILAAVSLPDFNPLDINAANDDQKFNRFALGVYEMGSTFKTFTTAILLERIDPSLGQTFDASKPIVRGRFRINDFHGKKTTLTVPEVFMHSSNIGTALMAEKVGTPVLKDFFKTLGLMQPVPIDLPERAAPLLPNPWREISTITTSYGHGMSVTPLHLIRAFASIVNGGTLPALHVIKNEKDEMRPRVISEKTSDEMRQLLRLVVTNGTAKSAIIPETLLAGKTGTSEKIVNGRYVRKKLISSFIATFPADKPRYAVLISVDEPVGNKKSYGYATAGWVAVPAVAALTKSMVALDNIPASGTLYDENLQTKMLEYMPLEKKEAERKAAAANKMKKPIQ